MPMPEMTDPLLDDSWMQGGVGGGLEEIADYNIKFELDNTGDGGNGTIDPQLTFSNPSTPAGNQQQQYNNTAGFGDNTGGLGQTLSPEPSAYDTMSQNFNGQNPGSPYFHQSIEMNPAPIYHPSPLRNNYRRSVSEPPGGPPMQHQQQAAPAVMFHRDNHFLGNPLNPKPMPLKSLPKNKQMRRIPYPPQNPRKMRSVQEQQQQSPLPSQHHGIRPGHHRAYTQPVAAGPTSAPVHGMPPQYMGQYMQPHMMMHEPQEQQQFASSRVCTPAPENGIATPPPAIDPSLGGLASTPQIQTRKEQGNTISIPMTVEELKAIIYEAVQKAVKGGEGEKGAAGISSPQEMMAKVKAEESPKVAAVQ